ncbi:MAG: hypothetical protein ACO1NN_02870 [Sphingopyxis sp.]
MADDHSGLTRAAAWLSLAAAPTFAIMAALTAIESDGPAQRLCGAANSPFGGMVPMYLLMSVIHSGAWLRLLDRRRRRVI